MSSTAIKCQNWTGAVSDLEDNEKDKKEQHVDNVEDDGFFDSNAKEQSRTHEQPVFHKHVPQPTTYKHTQTHT